MLPDLAEEEGFEPPRRFSTDLLVFKTNLFSLLSIPPYIGAQGETRTHTSQRTTVFETAVAAITPLEHSTPTFNAREAFTSQVGNGLLYNISLLC